MTGQEFNYEFDILWDNIMSNQAPSLDEYEKSVFLTYAQDAYVKQLYTSFENDEASRSALQPLVVQYSPETINGTHIVPESKLYKKPEDLMFIVYETAKVDSKLCKGNKPVIVKPVTHDDFWEIYNNPFKGANGNRILRISHEQFLELISKDSVKDYTIRYVKKPKPIIIANITTPIEGITMQTDCELPAYTHSTILTMATQLAKSAWIKQN